MKSESNTKIALITGCTRGLGLAVARLLAAQNYKIILTGRSQRMLEIACKQLMNPENHVIFCGDLLEENTIRSLCDLPFFPDVIVHSLGGKIEGDEQPLKDDILARSVALNLGVAASLNSHYLPLMKQAARGRIIHISSDASETGRSAPGYVAAKAAINAYVKSTARFYAKYNIMMCAVLPSVFLYPDSVWDTKRKTEPQCYEKRLQEQPLGRFLLVEEISQIIAEMASSNSMTYTGTMVKLTGAYS